LTSRSNVINNLKTIQYFIKETNKISKKYIPMLILTSAIRAINPFIIVIMPKFIIDELLGKQRINNLIILVTLTIMLNFIFSFINRFLDRIVEIQNEKIVVKFQDNIGKKVMEIKFENLEDPTILKKKEEALFAINSQQAISQVIFTLTNLINNFIMIIGYISIISMLNILIVFLILTVVIVNSFLYNKMQEIQYKSNMEVVEVNRHFSYYASLCLDFSYAKDIRLFNMKQFLMDKIVNSNSELHRKVKKTIEKTSKLSGLNSINIEVQNLITYLYLTYMAVYRNIGVGNFTMYFSATNNLSSTISDFIGDIITINQLVKYLDSYKEFYELPNNDFIKNGLILENIEKIELKNVSFKYPKSDVYSLKNINLIINSGDRISIVGLNGAGKTTLIKLIIRLYKPTEGEILVNGINIEKYDYGSYINKFSAVFQDFKLFSFSIRENIKFDNDNKNEDSNIIDILEHLSFKENLLTLEHGLDTCVYKNFDSNGIEFSGGQSQKIAMARALYKKSEVIILDEPTAALDPIAENEIYNSFNEITKNKTTIFISHRLASCKISDNIAVLEDGYIVQYGNHNELIINENGLYNKMYSLQVKQYLN